MPEQSQLCLAAYAAAASVCAHKCRSLLMSKAAGAGWSLSCPSTGQRDPLDAQPEGKQCEEATHVWGRESEVMSVIVIKSSLGTIIDMTRVHNTDQQDPPDGQPGHRQGRKRVKSKRRQDGCYCAEVLSHCG